MRHCVQKIAPRPGLLHAVQATVMLAMIGGSAFAASAPSLEEVLREVQMLKKKVQAQAEEIAQLKKQSQRPSVRLSEVDARKGGELDAVIEKKVDRAIDSHLRKHRAARLSLNPAISRLALKGDLRLRYESRRRDLDAPGAGQERRSRFRTRFRLGLTWKNRDESWEIGAGLATGGSDGRSTNDTWNESSAFETGDIRLDYAYAKHSLPKGLSLTLGQQKNPFVTSYILWDGDLRPTGATLGWHGDSGFLTLGGYDVLWGPGLTGKSDSADVLMGAFQAGMCYETRSGWRFLAALGGWYFNHDFREADPTETKAFKHSPGLYGMPGAYKVCLGDLYLSLSAHPGKHASIEFYGHGVKNFGADGTRSQQLGNIDPGANDQAWLLGIRTRYKRIKVDLSYAHIEADAVFGPMKDSDFGEGAGLEDTNLEGWKLGLSYRFTRNFNLGLTAICASQIEGKRDANLLQLDANYRF